jgi:hypothetical protein
MKCSQESYPSRLAHVCVYASLISWTALIANSGQLVEFHASYCTERSLHKSDELKKNYKGGGPQIGYL